MLAPTPNNKQPQDQTMLNRITIAAIAALFLAGCASAPPLSADYGTPPTNYEAKIKHDIDSVLRDPGSAQYRFSEPAKGFKYGDFHAAVTWTGYLVPFEVNGKNAYGGYTGFSPYVAIFDGNQVEKIYGPESTAILQMRYANGDRVIR